MGARLRGTDANLEWPESRRRRARMLADKSSSGQTMNRLDERQKTSSLVAGEPKQQHSAPQPTPRTLGGRVFAPERLTLLPEPETDPQGGPDGGETAHSSNRLLSARNFAGQQTRHFSSNEMQPDASKKLTHAKLAPAERTPDQAAQGQSSAPFGSTTALLILVFCYILWQCFKSCKNKPPKCLADDWPTGLLTPSRERKKRWKEQSAGELASEQGQEQCELRPAGQIEATTSGAGERPNKSAAILRVRSDDEGGRQEVDIIQVEPGVDTGQRDGGQRGASRGKLRAIRRGLARGSLVVSAANRAAMPRVKLIGAQVRKFVDIEAQDLGRTAEGQSDRTFASRLLLILQASGLVRRPSSAGEPSGTESAMQDAATRENLDRHEQENTAAAGSKSPPQPADPAAKVVVPCGQVDASMSSSFLGLAGSFLESSATSQIGPSLGDCCNSMAFNSTQTSLQQHCPGLKTDQQRLLPSPTAAFDSAQLASAPTSTYSKMHSPVPPQPELRNHHQLNFCCNLSRSKSHTSQPLGVEPTRNRLLARSPTNIRPCCSVSPSAMNRHEPHLADKLVCPQQQATFSRRQPQSAQHSLQEAGRSFQPALGQAAQCGNSRAKHQYENYYDDEREDAYRRLTASIGVQFGMALDPHQQAALLTSATNSCSTAVCKCSSSSPRGHLLASETGADLSLGESDSGHFSFATTTKQRYNSESICNDSNCSLCQSSLLTTAGASQQAVNMFLASQPVTALESPPRKQVQAPLVARWHHRRRSTLYSRQPRRMSIAGVASNQMSPGGGGLAGATGPPQNHLNFLHHRASIASDGASTYQQQLQQHGTTGRHFHYPATQHYCSSQVKAASNYSSSAGSSSGLGCSGSQCLNTPTTGAFPYGSFALARPYCDPLTDEPLAEAHRQCSFTELAQPVAWHFADAHNLQTPGCPNQGLLSLNTNRKFSLPVQLESKVACHLMPPKSKLLFGPQHDDVANRPTASLCRPLQTFRGAHGQSLSQPSYSPSRRLVASSPVKKSAEQSRRSSQTIVRQSSFWLEDGHPESTGGTAPVAAMETAQPRLPQQLAQSDPVDNLLHADGLAPVASASSSACGPQQESKSSGASPSSPPPPQLPEAIGCKQLKRHQMSSSTSSASFSSPSPDFHRRPRQRMIGRANLPAGTTARKRLLGSLKQQRRRGHRVSSVHPASLQQRQEAAVQSLFSPTPTPNQSQSLSQDTANSTDEELKMTKQEDSLSSFDRDVTSAKRQQPSPDTNPASLERQCRDLWKLRATLHDDAHAADNWANYHQRLNRRYDSGYKSIENQFSSSVEGSVQSAANLSLPGGCTVAGGAARDESASREPHPRPQSGCSGMIVEQSEDFGPAGSQLNLAGSAENSNEEETHALLENCDAQHDEQ